MAIRKSAAAILVGMGSAGARGGKISAVTPAAVNTLTIPVANAPINTGIARAKAAGYTGGGGLTSMSVKGTDGVSTVDLGLINGSGTATNVVDVMLEFVTDLNVTSVTIVLTLAGAPTGGTPTVDAEVWGASM